MRGQEMMATRAWRLLTLNVLARALRPVHPSLFSLDPHSLMEAARRTTQLEDFGGDDLLEPLSLLAGDVEKEAKLTSFGRLVLRDHLLLRLGNRLRIEEWIRRDPGVLQERIERPIFIIGLPRTGTTYLHRLLASDPSSRIPCAWEMDDPVPPPEAETYLSDPRIDKLNRALRLLHWAAPALPSMHDTGAGLPEECISLMANDLASVTFLIPAFLPSYEQWLYTRDLTDTYRRHRRQLQLLQRKLKRDRWVLKAPMHMHGLQWLLVAYPDARIVMTHRDPCDAVASLASFLFYLRSTFSNDVAPGAIGEEVVDRLASYSARAESARKKASKRIGDPVTFVDVDYRDIVRAPIDVVEGVYERLEIPLDDYTRGQMRRYVETKAQHRHGVHHYTLEQFGLSRANVEERFSAHRASLSRIHGTH